MILFFDTETTGLPDYRSNPSDACQPHLVQIACILTEDNGLERASVNLIVNPGVPIPSGASSVHGISSELAERAGMSSATAIAMWDRLASRADLVVAHNIKFDWALIETAWHRAGKGSAFYAAHARRSMFCTLEAASPIVNLPPTARMVAAGFNKPKPPKLSECISHFFGEELIGAHDALVDVRACARIYFHLLTLEREVA